MSSRGARHRKKGPGGPSRPARSGRATPPIRRHRPDTSGVLDPTLARMVATLLETAHRAAPADHPGRAPALELWAEDLAVSAYADEAMPPEFYEDLARTLLASSDPLAPAVLASLAAAVEHDDADALRRHRDRWRADTDDPDRHDLGIGRPVAERAVVFDTVGEPQVSLVVGFRQAGVRHTIGLLVDDDLGGAGRELFVGPELDEVVARARREDGLVVADVALVEAATRAVAAIELALDDEVLDDDDLRMLPLLARRLSSIVDGAGPTDADP